MIASAHFERQPGGKRITLLYALARINIFIHDSPHIVHVVK